jgi:large-conductance mechanosensitive channel
MDQIEKTFTSEPRRLIGRIIIAVILGEAIWAMIVSIMNNLVVPWLGDVMGQSSGLPTSFVQRPYNYPELFVSILEVCIAGLVAAILNYFVQRPQGQGVQRVKSVKSSAPAGAVRMFPEPMKAPAPREASVPQPSPVQAVQHPVFREASPQNQNGLAQDSAPVALVPEVEAEPVVPPSQTAPAPAQPLPIDQPALEMKPAPVPPSVLPAVAAAPAKAAAPAPKTVAAKPTKPKEVYYNIVGEPMPSDDD